MSFWNSILGKVRGSSFRFHGKGEKEFHAFAAFLEKEGILEAADLQRILEKGQAFTTQRDSVLALCRQVLSMAIASEGELLSAVNRFYGIQAEALDDRIYRLRHHGAGSLRARAAKFRTRLVQLRVPIKLKLTVAFVLLISVTLMIVSLFVLQRQQEGLYQETVKTGKVSLAYFTNNAKVPLLDDNILELNAIVKEAKSVEGLVYAFIVGADGKIRAHSDIQKIGSEFKPFEGMEGGTKKEGEIEYFTYRTASNVQVLNLTRAITFGDKRLGEAHVGISIDFIWQQIHRERMFILFLGLVITLCGIAFAVFFGVTFSRPVEKLVAATRQIARGNVGFHVAMKRKDELGTLADSFNHMSDELKMKSLLQDTFGRYVSPEILKLILEDPEKQWLKGIRSEATILFTDIRGFTSYSESTEPEKIVEELNEYFSIATRCILEYGGYVDKFIGDAVLGVFGVPALVTNHGERAVRACVEMQARFREGSAKERTLLGRVGIGINSGVVIAGNLGSQVKMEYSIIGDSVNLASRLNHLAGPGEIIVSRPVYEQVREIVRAEALPPQKIKGKSREIEAFRVVGLNENKEEEVK